MRRPELHCELSFLTTHDYVYASVLVAHHGADVSPPGCRRRKHVKVVTRPVERRLQREPQRGRSDIRIETPVHQFPRPPLPQRIRCKRHQVRSSATDDVVVWATDWGYDLGRCLVPAVRRSIISVIRAARSSGRRLVPSTQRR